MLDKYNSWCFATFNTQSRYIASDAADAYEAINSFAQSFVNVVRATGGNNAKRNLIVNTYGACNGYGTWNNHLKDPLKEMKYPEDTATGHIAFQVHAYPSIVNTNNSGQITGNRSMNEIKNEIDDMVSALKTNLVAKGGPVIIGEWGTSNVDNAETDYDARRELMFQFCNYFVQKCKENDMATFYWMGLSDGIARSFPAFTQPDLALTILRTYHGSSFNPVLPDAANYGIGNNVKKVQAYALEQQLASKVYNQVAEETSDAVTLEEIKEQYPSVAVRHILVKAEAAEDGTYTDEAKEAAKAKAEEILAEWEAGDKTEESFAALAEEYSEDPGSSENGGLYDDVMQGQMVEEFDAFCFDENRQPGDTGIVYGESGSYAGYHVMYFVGEGDPADNETGRSNIAGAKMSEWLTSLTDGMDVSYKFFYRLAGKTA